ncbi:methyltransferase domain-containing protein [Komagataeibacter melaceti]|uniref:methyltransferase domain-containing protein n=1 Tax=Komagataeibacter melaceti TaxID=2766577 RepID=UPI0011E5A613|nr:methyltransferase domain-containing protein [Komagataeibacter melaceti]
MYSNFLAEFVDKDAIDIAVIGGVLPDTADDIMTGLVIWVNAASSGQSCLQNLTSGRNCILMRNVLQQIDDPRALIREAFEKLATGGRLVITVPHQFLFERKLRLPSRYTDSSIRFYTPATLLLQVEEAIDMNECRVRLLKDDDRNYDYSSPLEQLPSGQKRIVLVVERIARPTWANQVVNEATFLSSLPQPLLVPADSGPTKTYLISPFSAGINSVIILKLDHRGDFKLADLAMKVIKETFPSARISLVCGSWNLSNAQSSGLFDEILTLDMFSEDSSAKPNPPRDLIIRTFKAMIEGKTFDLAVDFRHFVDSRILLQCINARYRSGFNNYNSFPWLDISLDLPSPTVDGRVEQWIISPSSFAFRGGSRTSSYIHIDIDLVTAAEECLIWGPHCAFATGQYEFEFLIDCLDGGEKLRYDICTDSGRIILQAGEITLNGMNKVYFDAPYSLDGVEIRIYRAENMPKKWFFNGIKVRKSGAGGDIHQQEAMLLLSHLIAARLTLPTINNIFIEKTEK